jgi:membrane protease YdiL (CAAX protease family)
MSNVAFEPIPAPTTVPTPANVPAPLRPMLVLIGVFLAMALFGLLGQRQAAGAVTLPLPASRTAVYLGLIAMEWGLVWYVWKAGLAGSGKSLRDLIGGRWSGWRDVAVDAAIGLGTWGAWGLAGSLWSRWSGPDPAASIQSLLPQRPHEVALWIALSISAGFAEELVFRGYLQRQFLALTGSVPLAVLLQAALFGISHGYQGVRKCLRICVYALLFGCLAAWRRSLRPGMLAHAWTDVASGLLQL